MSSKPAAQFVVAETGVRHCPRRYGLSTVPSATSPHTGNLLPFCGRGSGRESRTAGNPLAPSCDGFLRAASCRGACKLIAAKRAADTLIQPCHGPKQCLLLAGEGRSASEGSDFFITQTLDWHERLDITVEVMRELSLATDPQAMNQVYTRRMGELFPTSRQISLSRRRLEEPLVRVTRSSTWKSDINPWKEQHRLPVLSGGLFAQLIYNDRPRIIDDIELDPDDPAAEYLEDQCSLIAILLYDGARRMNMVIANAEPYGRQSAAIWWMQLVLAATNGLARRNYRLRTKWFRLKNGRPHAAPIPGEVRSIPTDLAVVYQTCRRFTAIITTSSRYQKPLGILIADVAARARRRADGDPHSLTNLHRPALPPDCCCRSQSPSRCYYMTVPFVRDAFCHLRSDRGIDLCERRATPALVDPAPTARQALEGKQRLRWNFRTGRISEDVLVLVPDDQVILH